eukprot:158231_1
MDENAHLAAGTSTKCHGGATCTLEPPSTGSNCLRATTGSTLSDEGGIHVSVDSGNGYDKVSAKDYFSKGEIVIDQCFDTIVGVQVNSISIDGWSGVFELSTDGKSTYVPMICSDCAGETGTMPIRIDMDENTPLDFPITTTCYGGATCTL